MELVCTEDPLSRVDLLGIGCVMYSIATWSVYNYDYFEENCWPKPEEVPTTKGVIYREVIDKCWRNEYNNIPELCNDARRLDTPKLNFMLWFCIVPSALLLSATYLCEVMAN